MEFSNDTIDKLKNYVYVLTTPEGNGERIFYVGKGKGNRVFNHFSEAHKLKDVKEFQTQKHKKILEGNVKAYIVRHGLTEQESFEYETILIDINNMFGNKLTNIVQGHKNSIGPTVMILETQEVEGMYAEHESLQKFAYDNKLNITVIKLNSKETYEGLLGKDLSWGIEMLWRTSSETIEDSDIILGVNRKKIFGVFKYRKGTIEEYNSSDPTSVKKIKKQIKEYEDGGYVREELKNDLMTSSSVDGRKFFKVDTIIRPSIGSIDVKEIDHPLKELIKEELFNKYISDEKIKVQNPVLKFFGR